MLRLPYEGERIVFDILLPNPSTSKETGLSKRGRGRKQGGNKFTSLQNLEKRLEVVDIQAHFERNKHCPKVHVNLPRFKIESESELNGVLQRMGMTVSVLHQEEGGWIFQYLPSLGGVQTFSHHYQGRISLVFHR